MRVVELTKTEVSTLVNEQSIQEWLINVRNPLQFIMITPGAVKEFQANVNTPPSPPRGPALVPGSELSIFTAASKRLP